MSRICVECNKVKYEITDVTNYSISVYCPNCGDERELELDGFDEGGLEWVEAMSLINEMGDVID